MAHAALDPDPDAPFLDPEGVAYRVAAAALPIVSMLRALWCQAMHPHALAGVVQYSDFGEDPLGRFDRTGAYVITTVYGLRKDAEAAGKLVDGLHKRVRGFDPVTRQRYSAQDVESLLWVHCTQVHTMITVHHHYVERLTDAEFAQFYREMTPVAGLLGIPADRVPQTRAEMRAYLESQRGRLCVSESAMNVVRFVLEGPPEGPRWIAHVTRLFAQGAIPLAPRWMAELCGVHWSPARRTATYLGFAALGRVVNTVNPNSKRIAQLVRQARETPFVETWKRLREKPPTPNVWARVGSAFGY
ncbi:MAG: DUF2236 domain-containing protein [Myxococcales bacterium]|nr:DUF2236 domain-containing protein [Myxococcales bacterium]